MSQAPRADQEPGHEQKKGRSEARVSLESQSGTKLSQSLAQAELAGESQQQLKACIGS